MIDPACNKVAVFGLGIIGSRASDRLANAGWQIATWNRTPKGGLHETVSPADAARDRAILSFYLKDAPALRDVIGQIQDMLQPGQIVLNHATVDLETTRWLAALCASRGCRFLDCPFTGSKLAAAAGELVYYIGGDAGLADELDTYLSVTSKARIPCGDIGDATVIKLATNLISASIIQAAAEALAITQGNGVDPAVLLEAVSQNVSSSKLLSMKLPQMIDGQFETHFSLANMGKDSRYMLELAKAAGVDTPAIAAVSKRMAELCEQGLGDLDYSALVKPYLSAT